MLNVFVIIEKCGRNTITRFGTFAVCKTKIYGETRVISKEQSKGNKSNAGEASKTLRKIFTLGFEEGTCLHSDGMKT